jgi:Helix-turn-helix domain
VTREGAGRERIGGLRLTEKLAWLGAQMRRKGLSSTAKVILFGLTERSDADGTCFPSLRRIAEDCGLARSGAIRGVKELVDAGVVSRRRRLSPIGDLESTIYALNFDTNGRPENGSTSGQGWIDGRAKDGSTGRPEHGSVNPPNLNPSSPSERPAEPADEKDDRFSTPEDFGAFIFDSGLKYLTASGEKEKRARAFLGKLRKDYSDEHVAAALVRAAKARPSDPKPWLLDVLAHHIRLNGGPRRCELTDISPPRVIEIGAQTRIVWQEPSAKGINGHQTCDGTLYLTRGKARWL